MYSLIFESAEVYFNRISFYKVNEQIVIAELGRLQIPLLYFNKYDNCPMIDKGTSKKTFQIHIMALPYAAFFLQIKLRPPSLCFPNFRSSDLPQVVIGFIGSATSSQTFIRGSVRPVS